jgi:hypothetical protein
MQDLLVQMRSVLGGLGDAANIVVLLVLLIVLVIVGLLVTVILWSTSPRGRVEALLDERVHRSSARDSRRWAVRAGVLAVFLVAVLGADFYMSRPSRCAECHRDNLHAEALERSPHAAVDCMECHRAAGVTAAARQGLAYTRWIVTYTVTQEVPEAEPGSVESAACMRCHSDIRETRVYRGIRVRHSDFLDEGYLCRDCHNSASHPGAVAEPSEPSMDSCIVCHDGESISAECDVCHVQEVIDYVVAGRDLPQTTTVDMANCYECHDNAQECFWCHGATMPHPAEWYPDDPVAPTTAGTHARAGFVDRESCWRCHYGEGSLFNPTDEACRCHGLFGPMHGAESWIAEHGLQATGRKTGIYAECFMCHNNRLCDNCHPASYAERYAPRQGPDAYRRSVPHPPDYFDF